MAKLCEDGWVKTYLVTDVRDMKQWSMRAYSKQNPAFDAQAVLAEPRMTFRLNHPVIPQLLEVVEDNLNMYVLREHAWGRPMDVLLQEHGALPPKVAVKWGITLCYALQHLHTQNPPLIYRSMKPANVSVYPDGVTLKLTSFNTLRVYDPRKTGDTENLGTVGYAAPEQFSGALQSDFRTDIYGLGMTMYHMLTGHNPSQPPYGIQMIRQKNPAVSAELEAIVLRCIDPNPANRFQSCAQLLAALEAVAL